MWYEPKMYIQIYLNSNVPRISLKQYTYKYIYEFSVTKSNQDDQSIKATRSMNMNFRKIHLIMNRSDYKCITFHPHSRNNHKNVKKYEAKLPN